MHHQDVTGEKSVLLIFRQSDVHCGVLKRKRQRLAVDILELVRTIKKPYIHAAGMVCMLALMVVIMYNDISRLIVQ